MTWSENGSLDCDRGQHEECDGVAVWFDQDGPGQRRTCGCYCHHVKRDVDGSHDPVRSNSERTNGDTPQEGS